VTFDIDANGIVNVSAKDRATQKEQRITITGSSSLDKNDIERMVTEAAAHADEDHRMRAMAEARNKADSLAYQVERNLKELGDKVPSDQKLQLESGIEKLREALKGDDVDEITRLTGELEQASYTLAELLYRQSDAGTEGGPGPETAPEHDGSGPDGAGHAEVPNEDVIDAEFKPSA
jgi:molecular chaperone DnaK